MVANHRSGSERSMVLTTLVPAPANGAQQSPSFRPMSIVATVACSATDELLLVFFAEVSSWESVKLVCWCGTCAGEEAVRRLFACKGKDPYRCFVLLRVRVCVCVCVCFGASLESIQ